MGKGWATNEKSRLDMIFLILDESEKRGSAF